MKNVRSPRGGIFDSHCSSPVWVAAFRLHPNVADVMHGYHRRQSIVSGCGHCTTDNWTFETDFVYCYTSAYSILFYSSRLYSSRVQCEISSLVHYVYLSVCPAMVLHQSS